MIFPSFLNYIYILSLIFSYIKTRPLQVTFHVYAREYVKHIIRLYDNETIKEMIPTDEYVNQFATYGPLDITYGEKIALSVETSGNSRLMAGYANIEGYCFPINNPDDTGVWYNFTDVYQSPTVTDSDGEQFILYKVRLFFFDGERKHIANMKVPDETVLKSSHSF